MRILVAMDSFKGCISSEKAGDAVRRGILKAYPDNEVIVKAVSDGGEGMSETLIGALDCSVVHTTVSDPLQRQIDVSYGFCAEKKLAVMEMASAAGITLLSENEKDPMETTTYGVGEMIADALHRGAREFIIGIGGSATNDGGIGMLQALGFEFCDREGCKVSPCGKGLKDIAVIDARNVLPEIRESRFRIACDVNNPLCGENGCSAVFGPQKGLHGDDIPIMDSWLRNYAELTKEKYPSADMEHPGAGAAGGIGFAFRSYLDAELLPGIDMIIRETGIDSEIRKADIIVTGEGCFDRQSVMGKVPGGIAKAAKKYNKTVIALVGMIKDENISFGEYGIDACFHIIRQPMSLREAMDTQIAEKNLMMTAEQVFRLIGRI
ncbi:MAG: glycerate kinase [Oscillospiraceae bacterium]|nr:glycerate kinase [Oscillospiraceae bacterium]